MKYDVYSVQDLANDSFFIRWVKNPDKESDLFWQSFMNENPDSRSRIEQARAMINALAFPAHQLSEEDLTGMRNSLLMAFSADEKDVKAITRSSVIGKDRLWLKLAAAVLVMVLVLSVIFVTREKPTAPPLPYTTAMESRVNPVGQKSVLFLSDGTKVWLNAASKISYAEDFTEKSTRDVYLEGEAFFDVVHDRSKPFVVHTSSINIKVMGTSFNVKSYAEEKSVQTTLVYGKVLIEQADANGKRIGDVELKPNQCATFDRESKVIQVREVVASRSESWKSDRLVFDEEPMDHVILQLERWFNVKIHAVNKGSLTCKLTASVESESLRDVLKLVEASHNVHCRIEGNDVYIDGTLCEM